ALLATPLHVSDGGFVDTVDDFFVQASQLAAKQRLKELRSGADPIAVALSKCSNTSQTPEESVETEESQQRVGEEKIPQDPFRLGAWKEIQTMRENKANGISSEDGGSSEPSGDKLVLTRTADGGTTVEREEVLQSSVSDQYQSHKDLLETRLLMEQRIRIRQQNEEIEERIETRERETKNEVDDGDSDSPVSEKPKDPMKTSFSSKKGIAKLSSDGKELFEPTQEMLDINQENVQKGIVVLTAGLMALQSIVDKE
ncbi:hypothetical protein THAOC_14933, partial [Thalassiosira oceanica]